MDDIKNFRQFGSRTPGHPEVEIPGVECTTGPLGQGFAMGAGMAHAEAYLRNLFTTNNNTDKLIDHYTYVLASDGDLQEPVALGSASLAGHLGLSKLIVSMMPILLKYLEIQIDLIPQIMQKFSTDFNGMFRRSMVMTMTNLIMLSYKQRIVKSQA